jgi:deazaflavin-dependent oxidoreductase (nitroreductase family)
MGRDEERQVTETNEFNANTIAEFRANEGRVGGVFEGAPIALMHHTGRNSNRDYVTPLMYLADDDGSSTIYIFASKAGAPTNPSWYYNLKSAGSGRIDVGTDSYDVTVIELAGEERDRVYAKQASRFPGFAEYAEKTAGIRTIPVLKLRRA